MAYELSDIKAALNTIISAVVGIGQVHSRERYTQDPATFKSLFLSVITGDINGCCITRSAYLPELALSSQVRKRHEMTIWCVYGYKDSDNSASTFQTLVSAIVDAINGNLTYADAWHVFQDGQGAVASLIEIREWAGYFVHYAEIKVTVEVRA